VRQHKARRLGLMTSRKQWLAARAGSLCQHHADRTRLIARSGRSVHPAGCVRLVLRPGRRRCWLAWAALDKGPRSPHRLGPALRPAAHRGVPGAPPTANGKSSSCTGARTGPMRRSRRPAPSPGRAQADFACLTTEWDLARRAAAGCPWMRSSSATGEGRCHCAGCICT
jgi:hypothetical protein